jgi:Pyruvate/2-oxoacid:ferredoxin oxidoreductase gamma subunit
VVERELVMTGIGGQGIQLATQLLARAAIAEGREVQLFGSYGGMMRGGNTEATIVIADGPIEAPPTVGQTWSAILMHHEYVGPTLQRIRPGSVILVNTTVFDARGAAALDRTHCTVIDVPASDLAVDVGSVMTASMVMLGSYAAVTEIVALDALEEAVAAALPSYRAQHVALNIAALRAGHAAAPRGAAAAWTGVAA